MSASQRVFDADLERYNALFAKLDAINTTPEGFRWIDVNRVPAAAWRGYRMLLQYGYANGLLP